MASTKVDSKDKESDRNPSVKRSPDRDDEDASAEEGVKFEQKKKISFGISKPPVKLLDVDFNPLNRKHAGSAKKSASQHKKVESSIPKPSAFGDDSDEEDDEEMPPEAKMRMKNIGRGTPTSSGPNSFGKGRMGFCDTKKILERQLMDAEKQKDNDLNT